MASSQEPTRHPSKRSRREVARDVSVLTVVVLAVVFAVVNVNSVNVDWIVSSSQAPLIIVIAISVIAGFILGRYGQRAGRRRH